MNSLSLYLRLGTALLLVSCSRFVAADVRVSPGGGKDVSIVATGNTVYAAWEDTALGKVMVDRSDDGGRSWGTILKPLGTGFSPRLALDKRQPEAVYLTWEASENDAFNTNSSIYFAQSADRGVTFSTPLDLGQGRNPYVASSAFGEYVFVVYHRYVSASPYILFLRRSLNGGLSFEAEVQVTDSSSGHAITPDVGHALAVTPDGQYVHIVFRGMEGNYWQTHYRRSTDFGQTFGPEQNLNIWPHTSYNPSVAFYQNRVFSLFRRDWYGHNQIWLRWSTDFGETWPTGQWARVDDGASKYGTGGTLQNYSQPRLGIDADGVLFTTFVDATNLTDGGVFMDRSTDGGMSFGPDRKVDQAPCGVIASRPTISVGDDACHLSFAWEDNRDGTYAIYARPADDDNDGRGARCDNCPSVANTGQQDGDADGFGDVCDCAAGDNQVWARPGEVGTLRLSHTTATGTTTLTWSAVADPGGRSAVYDTIRSDTPAEFEIAATCVESDGSDTTSTDTVTPSAGEAFYYLIRAENSCGTGPLGPSCGSPRAARACP